MLLVVVRVDWKHRGFAGRSGATSASRSVATAARASPERGKTRTILGWQWRVRELAQRGVRRAHWSNAGNTGAWGASSMAASCLCSHGGFG